MGWKSPKKVLAAGNNTFPKAATHPFAHGPLWVFRWSDGIVDCVTTSWGGVQTGEQAQGFVEIKSLICPRRSLSRSLSVSGLTAPWRRGPSLCRDSPPG